jgi:hypothetical protein
MSVGEHNVYVYPAMVLYMPNQVFCAANQSYGR